MFDLNKGVYESIDEFYEAPKHLLSPKSEAKLFVIKRNDQAKRLIEENSLVIALLTIHHS